MNSNFYIGKVLGLGCVSAAIATGAVLPATAQAASFGDYNLIVFEDLHITSEVEGNTLVGGNLTGAGTFATRPGGALANGPDVLTVGGNIDGHFNIQAGNVRYGGTQSGSLNLNGGSGTQAIQDPTLDISDLQQQLTEESRFYASLDTTVGNNVQLPGSQPSAVRFISGGESFAVFNVNASDIFSNKTQQIELNGVDPNTDTILINVSGTDINWSGSNMVGALTGDALQQKVVWNFHEATNLSFSPEFHGSVLAPNAHLRISTPVEGSITVKSFEMYSEVHLPTFTGSLPTPPSPDPDPVPVPEPTMILGMLTIAGAGVTLKRKQSQSV